jgi:hypothetical protein
MKSTLSPRVSTALAGSVQKWPTLKDDLAKARAVAAVASPEVSNRVLAKQLGCSATQIRNFLLIAKKAPWQDQLLARRGKITTRELLRRARAAEAQQKKKEQQTLDDKRTKEAEKGCKTICKWLEQENVWSAHGEEIIDEARWILHGAARLGTLPQGPPPPLGTPLKEIIQRCRPKPEPGELPVSRYAHWLAIWAFYAFPDTIVRDRALGLALRKQIKG